MLYFLAETNGARCGPVRSVPTILVSRLYFRIVCFLFFFCLAIRPYIERLERAYRSQGNGVGHTLFAQHITLINVFWGKLPYFLRLNSRNSANLRVKSFGANATRTQPLAMYNLGVYPSQLLLVLLFFSMRTYRHCKPPKKLHTYTRR